MDPLSLVLHTLFGRWKDDPSDLNYYVKIFFACISAIICGVVGPAFAGTRGIVFGLLIYIISLYVLVYIMNMDPEALGGYQKLVTDSLPSYLLLWVLLWTLIYAFTLPPSLIENLALAFGS
jgi:hypothetical protein